MNPPKGKNFKEDALYPLRVLKAPILSQNRKTRTSQLRENWILKNNRRLLKVHQETHSHH